MTDVKRIRELSTLVTQTGHLMMDDAQEISEALDELARIKGAALSEEIAEIEKRHSQEDGYSLGIERREEVPAYKAAHQDRATLLDALRAKEAEISQLEGELADALEAQTPLMDAAHIAKQERDAARAQLAQAQKELEIVRESGLEFASRAGAERKQFCQRINELSEVITRDSLKLAQAERDKAAMREGLRLYRAEAAAQDVSDDRLQARKARCEWKRDHGALVPRDGEAEPSKPRLLPCSVCGAATEWRCADCRLRLGVPVAVCNSRGCQDRHEQDEKAGAEILAAHRDAKPANP